MSLALLGAGACPAGAGPSSVEIGAQVSDLQFTDIRYLPRRLSELEKLGSKDQPLEATVIVFTTTGCPLAKRYLGKLKDMAAAYRPQGVVFVSMNVGNDDSVMAVAEQQRQLKLDFPCVKDTTGATVRALGVERTPEVVILDRERKLRYRGRVDAQYRFGGVQPGEVRADLAIALDEVLAGKPVSVAETAVDGCLITLPEAKQPERAPGWAQVAPIVYRHCTPCHRPGAEAPFELQTYEDVSSVADMLGEVVGLGRMPPWFAKEGDEGFHNERRLSAAEKQVLLDWVAAKAPQGQAPAPAPPKFPDVAWSIGTPGTSFKTPTYSLPAAGYVNYKYALLPQTFEEDTWVSGMEVRNLVPEVLHHCNVVAVRLTETGFKVESFLTGKVPGSRPMDLAAGMAAKIPAGCNLVLQIHYVTIGREVEDQLELGLRFPKEPVQQRLRVTIAEDREFEIPAGRMLYPVKAEEAFPTDVKDVECLGLLAHMHLRGRDMTFTARYPDGRRERLLTIPNYNFDWQLAYRWLPGQKTFPGGTVIEASGHFDNSAWNPYNPDPTKNVRWGQQTFHEMFYGFVFWVDKHERLGLTVDPKTGQAVAQPQPQPRPKPNKRYY